MFHVNLQGRTWRIIPVSKWSVTPIYKPFRPFGWGTTLLRGRNRSPWLLTPYPSPGMILQVAPRRLHGLIESAGAFCHISQFSHRTEVPSPYSFATRAATFGGLVRRSETRKILRGHNPPVALEHMMETNAFVQKTDAKTLPVGWFLKIWRCINLVGREIFSPDGQQKSMHPPVIDRKTFLQINRRFWKSQLGIARISSIKSEWLGEWLIRLSPSNSIRITIGFRKFLKSFNPTICREEDHIPMISENSPQQKIPLKKCWSS